MVPRQFIALLRRHRQERIRAEYGPALIVSAITALMSRKPASPRTFMPSMPKREQETPWQDQMAALRGTLEALGGK